MNTRFSRLLAHPLSTLSGHAGVHARLRWTTAPARDFFLMRDHG